jgi:acyl carrier protein
MDRTTVIERLTAIFRDVFDDPSLGLRDDLTAADVPAWDSLTHINLIVAVEKQFRIRLTTAEIRSLTNVGDFVSLISKKAS